MNIEPAMPSDRRASAGGALGDARLIERLAPHQRGVFSKHDLQAAFAERHSAAFVRRVKVLEAHGVLRRFIRGWYVAQTFDVPTLSQRIAPESFISFGTVLARALLIGPRPERQILGVKVGRTRTYSALGYQIVHVGIAPHLDFGHAPEDGVKYADPERATLDVLYFHLRGRRYVFDLYSDIRFEALNEGRLIAYLKRYKNPKFVAFARQVIGL